MMKIFFPLAAVLLICLCNVQADPTGLYYLTDYSVFVNETCVAKQSACMGRIATGGNVVLSQYSVGEALVTNCQRGDLIVGGSLTFNDGECNRGFVSYALTASVNSVSTFCGVVQRPTGINFTAAWEMLQNTTTSLGKYPANGKANLSNQYLSLVGTDPNINVFAISSATVNAITALNLNVPNNSYAYINIGGTNVTIANMDMSVSATTNRSLILFNTPQALSLTVSNVALIGGILAPNAILNFPMGQLNGSLAAISFQGSPLINYVPFIDPGCICPPCPSLISLPPYSIYVRFNATMMNSQNQGPMAVGGNCTLSHYSVGTALNSTNAPTNVLVVGGNLNFTQGSVNNGNILVTGKAQVSEVSVPNGQILYGPTGIDFATVFGNIEAYTQYVAQLTPNGVVSTLYSNMTLTGSDTLLNVFLLTSQQLQQATQLNVIAPAQSWVVINVPGETNSMSGMQMNINQIDRTRVLWNFFETTSLNMQGISVQGTLLGPRATIDFPNGGIDGSIYAESIVGQGQVSYFPWVPFTPPCPPCQCD